MCPMFYYRDLEHNHIKRLYTRQISKVKAEQL